MIRLKNTREIDGIRRSGRLLARADLFVGIIDPNRLVRGRGAPDNGDGVAWYPRGRRVT